MNNSQQPSKEIKTEERKFGINPKLVVDFEKVFEQYPELSKVLIFGSRARGDYRFNSDIDLALVSTECLSFSTFLRIGAKLDDLDMLYKVDLVDYNTISDPKLKESIERDGKIFYERKL